ncbi:MAG: hypothetical protein ACP5O2_07405 [Bacteroidales bacterium]
MSIKKILLTLLFAFFLAFGYAQQRLIEDVVFLKNGSVVRGLIVEETPLVSLKIQTADRSIFVFRLDEIEKIEHVYDFKPPHPPRPGILPEKPAGGPDLSEESPIAWNMGVEYTYGGSLRNTEVSNFHGLYGLIGYYLTPRLTTSLGFGVEDLQYINWIPIFVDVKMNINPEAHPAGNTPFLYGRLGVSTPTGEQESYSDYDAGFMAGVGFGFKMRLSHSMHFHASIGYRYQFVGYRSYIYPLPYPYPEPLPGGMGTGEVNTGTDPNGQPITIEPPYPDPNIWPPQAWEPVKFRTHGNFITFTFGISF